MAKEEINLEQQEQQEQEIKEFRRELSAQRSKLQKRIERLRSQGLENTPAIRNLQESYGFDDLPSLREIGRDWNSMRRYKGMLNQFENMKTSTVTGVKDWQKNIADSLGLQYERQKDIQVTLDNFLDIFGKLTQLQRSQGGVEIDSERRVTAINKYLETNEISLLDLDSDELVEEIDDMMRQEEQDYQSIIDEWEEEWFGGEGD